jgi:hypothetical protein
MVGSQNILSSSNERKFFDGNGILQIKEKESVRHTIEKFGGMHIIDVSEHDRCQAWAWPLQREAPTPL